MLDRIRRGGQTRQPAVDQSGSRLVVSGDDSHPEPDRLVAAEQRLSRD